MGIMGGQKRKAEENELLSDEDRISELLEMLKGLEYAVYGKCPDCGYADSRKRGWHERFGHAEDCDLARLIGAERGGPLDACDCYQPGRLGCSSSPLYEGKPFQEKNKANT